MPTFINLPVELIDFVAAELDTEDFLNLRLVCREINYKSSTHFLECYFHTRYHMLSRDSLENLIEVSNHTVFGPSVRTLEICTDHLTIEPPAIDPGDWAHPFGGDFVDVDEREYKRHVDDQNYLRESGLDTAYLTQALAHLPNCRTITIDDERRPWGAASIKRQMGAFPTSSIDLEESARFVKRALRVILTAVVASRLPLEALNICPGFNREAIGPDMLALPELCSNQLRSCLTSLDALDIMLNPNASGSLDDWRRGLVNFVMLFPDLGRFRLSFYTRDEEQRFRTISESLRLQRLRVLELSAVQCTEDDLARFILACKGTLREVGFDLIGIIAGGGTWQSLLCKIRDELSLVRLRMIDCELDEKLIGFWEGEGTRTTSTIEVGGDWQALTQLIECIRIEGGDIDIYRR